MKQREIKFRVWVKPEKKFYFLDVNTLLYETFSKWELEELVIQRFTGLVDKLGKEIYEGDIVDESVVVFYKGQFIPAYDFGDAEIWENDNLWNTNVEVTGNIYENPELLKE